MTLDEQIEAAWKNGDFMPETGSKYEFDAFAAGYRAMAKSLYREVKPEDVKRKGIEVKGIYVHIVPCKAIVAGATEEVIENLAKCSDDQSARFYKTVRDLMLAGF